MGKNENDVVLLTPSSKLVKQNLSAWKNSKKEPKYPVQEKALNFLFQKACPRHNDLQQVIIKVSALNDFYSTNIFDTYSVATHIRSVRDVKGRLERGDLSLVNELACVKIGGRDRNFYSFASKYCSHHKPDSYPIYDYYVAKVLMYYRDKSRFFGFTKEDLKKYGTFVEVIKKFRTYYKLDNSLREIDLFLWRTGREKFPRTY
jgi:hypothetical protein